MVSVRTLCLFCGASCGTDPRYRRLAAAFGAEVASRGIRLVFGGGHIGLMGAAADAALAAGGEVIGVIPGHLQERELGHDGLTELRVVATMHERKNLMFELSDAVAVLPGGVGTLDETFEVVTWKQLGLHDKPILMIDENGYWTPFDGLVRSVVAAGFAHESTRRLYRVVSSIDDFFDVLGKLPVPAVDQAVERL